MKLMPLIAAGVVASVVLAGCGSAPTVQQTPAQVLAAVHAGVSNACTVAGPTLDSMKIEEPGLTPDQAVIFDKIYSDTKAFCDARGTISVASVQEFANTAIPATLKVVNASPLSQSDKSLAAMMLMGVQATVNITLTNAGVAAPSAQ